MKNKTTISSYLLLVVSIFVLYIPPGHAASNQSDQSIEPAEPVSDEIRDPVNLASLDPDLQSKIRSNLNTELLHVDKTAPDFGRHLLFAIVDPLSADSSRGQTKLVRVSILSAGRR